MNKRNYSHSVTASMLSLLLAYSCNADDCSKAAAFVKQGAELADDTQEERHLYQQAKELCPKISEADFNLGLWYERQGKLNKALAAYEQAKEKRDLTTYDIARAGAYTKLQNYQKAGTIYESVLEKDSKNIHALIGLSYLASNRGDYDKANQLLQRAQKFSPDNVLVHYNLAVIAENKGEYDRAVEHYNAALTENSQHVSSLYNLGMLYKRMLRYQKSAEFLKQVVNKQPNDIAVHQALATVFAKLDDTTNAELALRQILRLEDKNLDALVNLSILLLKRSQVGLAKPLIERAKQVSPEDLDVIIINGWQEFELGNYNSAESLFKRALSLDATNIRVYQNLITLYERTGNELLAEEYSSKLAQLQG